ncbi:MAG: hypothetical protein QW835_00025 [Candidatus Hadarchaeum sp.]
MTLKEINELLREIFREFIQKGYSCSEMANCFLDSQCRKRIFEFVEGERDFNLQSVERILESLGYRVSIVPVKRGTPSDGEAFIRDFIDKGEELLKSYVQYLHCRAVGKLVSGGEYETNMEHSSEDNQESPGRPAELSGTLR